MPEIQGISVPFLPAGGIDALRPSKRLPIDAEGPKTSFKDVFREEVEKLKFSAHAQTRLDSREIPLSQSDINKIESAVHKAEGKGAKESLVIYGDTAFIVNVPNKTVITAVNSNQLKENIFTNIDSAIIV